MLQQSALEIISVADIVVGGPFTLQYVDNVGQIFSHADEGETWLPGRDLNPRQSG